MRAVKYGREITTHPAPKPDQGSRILYTGGEERTCQRVPELGRPVEKKEKDVYVSVIHTGWSSSPIPIPIAADYEAGHETIIRV